MKIGLNIWFKAVQFIFLVLCFFCIFSPSVIFRSSGFYLFNPLDLVYWTSSVQISVSTILFCYYFSFQKFGAYKAWAFLLFGGLVESLKEPAAANDESNKYFL